MSVRMYRLHWRHIAIGLIIVLHCSLCLLLFKLLDPVKHVIFALKDTLLGIW